MKMLHNRKSYIKTIFKRSQSEEINLIPDNTFNDINNSENETNQIEEQDRFSNTDNIVDSSDK
jgi:hypothetical protein